MIRLDWQQMGFDRLLSSCKSCALEKQTKKEIIVSAELTLGARAISNLIVATVRYCFAPQSGVTLRYDVEVKQQNKKQTLPRLGVQFSMPAGTEQLRYFGRGPVESYQDKNLASRFGEFESSVTDHFEHYMKPQENMAHADTSWAKIYTPAGHGLMILGTAQTPTFSFNCAHYSPMQLTRTRYDFELTPLAETVVNVDFKQAGIGSNSCGPHLPDQYAIYAGEYHYSFRFIPMFANNVDPYAEKLI